ncbi:MAG: Cache 3/Cache 2 fusion domain-containing protein, partial [Deltaproteobacteria bacterium]|nr:Cache 3/Cache 2 fusion domain-containing protein [Deltaproteobacteria bacterium]
MISEPYESKRTGSPVLTFTRPVFDTQGKLIAVVACSMNLLESEALGQLLNQNVFNYGYLFLFDKSRLIIIHPDSERVLKRDIPEGANDLLDKAINGQEGVGETVNSRGMPMLSAFRSVPNSSWFVGVQVQQSQAYANLRDSRRLLLGILVVSLITVILICIMAIHRITRPLLFLHSAARLVVHELETGDKSDPAKIQKLLSLIRSQDEMGDLASAFGELVNRQRQSVGMLREANSALEESNGKLAALSTTD